MDVFSSWVRQAQEAYHRDPSLSVASVTELIQPYRISALTRAHVADMEPEDGVTSALYGSILHDAIERWLPRLPGDLVEQPLTMRHGHRVLSGTVDLYRDGVIYDWKSQSAISSPPETVEPEWERQENLYKLLLEANGYEVKAAKIVAFPRDWGGWSKWPQPYVILDSQLWSIDGALDYLDDRLDGWFEACANPENAPLCTDEERWHTPPRYAVRKEGNTRATKTYDSREEAEKYIEAAKPKLYHLEERGGGDTRCLHYCRVAEWCDHGSKLRREAAETHEHAFTSVNGED